MHLADLLDAPLCAYALALNVYQGGDAFVRNVLCGGPKDAFKVCGVSMMVVMVVMMCGLWVGCRPRCIYW